jgi:hypothetical protein
MAHLLIRRGNHTRSPNQNIMIENGGAEEDRTPDLRIANATLSQLSYGPTRWRQFTTAPPGKSTSVTRKLIWNGVSAANLILFFRCDGQTHPGQFIGHGDLTGQPRSCRLETFRIFQKLQFIVAGAGQLFGPCRVYIYVTGCAGAHSATQRLYAAVNLPYSLHNG